MFAIDSFHGINDINDQYFHRPDKQSKSVIKSSNEVYWLNRVGLLFPFQSYRTNANQLRKMSTGIYPDQQCKDATPREFKAFRLNFLLL